MFLLFSQWCEGVSEGEGASEHEEVNKSAKVGEHAGDGESDSAKLRGACTGEATR